MVRNSLKERYAFAQEVLDDLQPLISPSIPLTIPIPPRRLPRPRFSLPIVLGLTGIVLLGGIAVYLVANKITQQTQITTFKYQNQNLGIKIDYPTNWTYQEDFFIRELAIYPQEFNLENSQDNVIITIEPLNNPNLSLEEYT